MSILVATDGSSLRSLEGEVGKGPIGWAWARDDGHWYRNAHSLGTNQKAELLALLTVLFMHPKEDLHIQLDSMYALNTAEKWMWGWAKKNWVNSSGEPIANIDVVQKLYETIKQRDAKIEYEWVKGHNKSNPHPLNTKADELANTASNVVKSHMVEKASLQETYYLDSKGRTFNEHEFLIVAPLLKS